MRRTRPRVARCRSSIFAADAQRSARRKSSEALALEQLVRSSDPDETVGNCNTGCVCAEKNHVDDASHCRVDALQARLAAIGKPNRVLSDGHSRWPARNRDAGGDGVRDGIDSEYPSRFASGAGAARPERGGAISYGRCGYPHRSEADRDRLRRPAPSEINDTLALPRSRVDPIDLGSLVKNPDRIRVHGERASQTDLLALLRTGDRYLVVGVEGKAREPFGTTVADWNNGGWAKRTRLADLCERLDLEPEEVGELRYQLLHRTVATLLEAARYGVVDAVMLVQSFDTGDASFGDFDAFAEALGLTDAAPGKLTAPMTLDGVSLRLGWARSPATTTADS